MPRPPQIELPSPLRLFLLLALALTLLCVLTELVCAYLLHLPYPYNWPLLEPIDFFRDFYLYKPRYAFFHSPLFFTFKGPEYMYPAPLAVVYKFFYLFPPFIAVLLDSLFAVFVLATALFRRALSARGLAPLQIAILLTLTWATSYAFFFEFQQANVEFIVWLLVALGVWIFLRGHGYPAALCFGLAGAMKVFPLVFLGLFLSRRQYRQALATLAASALTTLGSLWLLCPDIPTSWRGTQQAVALFRKSYMLQYSQVSFDHSLFALPKKLLMAEKFIRHTRFPRGEEVLAPMLAFYLPLVALGGIFLYFVLIRKLPILNQVLCLTVASILLPPVSYDYTLIHLYIPWALLVLFTLDTRRPDAYTPTPIDSQRSAPPHPSGHPSGLPAVFACFAVLLAPESEFLLFHHGMGGQIKAVALVILFVLGLRHRFPSDYDLTPQPPLPA